MSGGKAAGLALAIVCGVATGYSTFAPELQKQQAERFGPTHALGADTGIEAEQLPRTIVSNDDSLGASVREAIQETKQDIQEATKDSTKSTSWPGISFFKWSYGGASSPRADEQSKEQADGTKKLEKADKP